MMQSFSKFISTAEPIPEVEKSELINDYGNILAYCEESKQSKVWANKFGLVQIHFGGSMGWLHPRKRLLFLLSFKLETLFPS